MDHLSSLLLQEYTQPSQLAASRTMPPCWISPCNIMPQCPLWTLVVRRGTFSASLWPAAPLRDHVGLRAGCCIVRRKTERPSPAGRIDGIPIRGFDPCIFLPFIWQNRCPRLGNFECRWLRRVGLWEGFCPSRGWRYFMILFHLTFPKWWSACFLLYIGDGYWFFWPSALALYRPLPRSLIKSQVFPCVFFMSVHGQIWFVSDEEKKWRSWFSLTLGADPYLPRGLIESFFESF